MTKYAILLGLLLGCGDNDRYTWGDVVTELGEIYCTTAVECGYTDINVELCTEHIHFHNCYVQGTCDMEVDEMDAQIALNACAESLEAPDETTCFWLTLNVLPPDCMNVVALEPE